MPAVVPGILAAYLCGAVPFGLLVARARGIDIRSVGSGNIGATNVFRCVGKGWGLLTFALDVLKGLLPVLLLPRPDAAGAAAPLLYAGAAVAGHNWPVFLRFRGGKGVATSVGALLGIAPGAVGAGLGVWVAVMLLGRYVSLASICGAAAVAAFAWIRHVPGTSIAVPTALTILAGLAIWRHRANIQRLCRGEENRFEFRGRRDGLPKQERARHASRE
jgi:glycerol-3-phosphate acyltransferase PlsY